MVRQASISTRDKVFAILIITVFIALSFTRSYDFKTFGSILNDTGNDWGTYASYASDILHNGILMPSVNGPYYSPAGWLYNYFLALCLAVFGQKVQPIYVIQHIMLALSVVLIYWTFRDKMRGVTAALFLAALLFFAYKDVYKNYAPLLLSENLALFTISVFFFCFIRGFGNDRFALQIASAVMLALSILTRPNIALYGVLLLPVLTVYYIRQGRPWIMKVSVFMAVFFLSVSMLAIRNYMVCRKPVFLPAQVSSASFLKLYHPIPASVDLSKVSVNPLYSKLHLNKEVVEYAEYAMQEPSVFLGHYLSKAVFCLGFFKTLSPDMSNRRRWILMWLGYALYIFLRVRGRYRLELWEFAVHLYIFCYYASLIFSGPIHNYGFRMLIPAVFYVLALAFMGLGRLVSLIGREKERYLS
jgi:hypothetical protein